MGEWWKIIEDYPNYEVSNMGRVGNRVMGKVLRPGKNKGYLQVKLRENGKKKSFRIHRLVATVFIPNPESKPEVNHINGIKTDNRASNLEWCSSKENVNHAYRIGLIKTDKNIFKTNNPKQKRKVCCVETGQVFDSITECGLYFGKTSSYIGTYIYKNIKYLKKYTLIFI